ncbi:MAG: ECF transporter S component [Rikenellaceae bacterium]
MQTKTLRLYNLGFTQIKTYLFALAFVLGNILLPQLCHLMPQGGLIFLPIYFFTLIASYKYGLKVGLMTAVLSPVVNYLLFAMPSSAVLGSILVKSIFLAVAASLVASRSGKLSVYTLALVVLSYQLFGTAVEWIMVGDFGLAIQDFRIGIAGMLLQIVGGYLFIKHLIYK